MAKRYTDSEKWKKVWFRTLPPKYKCFWDYITSSCSFIGIWEVDIDLAEFYIGEKLELDKIKEYFSKQYQELNGGKRWFIRDFIDFQYGKLSPGNRVHHQVLKLLSQYGIKVSQKRPVLKTERAVQKTQLPVMDQKKPDFLESLKSNSIYSHIDIDTELGKMDVWLSLHPGRQKTKRFIVNWLNKIEKPLPIKQSIKSQLTYVKPIEQPFKTEVPKEFTDLAKKLAKQKGVK